MGFLHSMTLKAKLMLLTGVMLVALIITGVMGYRALSNVGDNVNTLAGENVPSLLGVYTLRIGVNQAVIQLFRTTGLDNDPKFKEELLDSLELRKKAYDTMDRGIKQYEPLPKSKDEAEIWKSVEQDFEKWRAAQKVIDEHMLAASKCNDLKDAQASFAKLAAVGDSVKDERVRVFAGLQKLSELIDKNSKDNGEKAQDTVASSTRLMMIVIATSLIVAIVLAMIIITSTNKAIITAVETINEGALQISDASDQVASSSTSLAQGASEQASSVEEVSATLEEASAAVVSNTENARQADILSKQANVAAKEGLAKGEELVVSMREVTESAGKIANIVKTIDQIAFQVNLLALNAAVEAARAGEHGLGFAVVADEVRNLAQRAANSAKETGVVIEEAVTQIKKGSQIAELASDSFRDIEDKAKKVSDLIGEVALSSKEQAEAVSQLNMAMAQIDQVTQQVAANSEEAAAASEELNAQAAAALEAIGVLAKIVGLDMSNTRAPKSSRNTRVASIAPSKPRQPIKRIESQSTKRANDEVFPLSESDLKEF